MIIHKKGTFVLNINRITDTKKPINFFEQEIDIIQKINELKINCDNTSTVFDPFLELFEVLLLKENIVYFDIEYKIKSLYTFKEINYMCENFNLILEIIELINQYIILLQDFLYFVKKSKKNFSDYSNYLVGLLIEYNGLSESSENENISYWFIEMKSKKEEKNSEEQKNINNFKSDITLLFRRVTHNDILSNSFIFSIIAYLNEIVSKIKEEFFPINLIQIKPFDSGIVDFFEEIWQSDFFGKSFIIDSCQKIVQKQKDYEKIFSNKDSFDLFFGFIKLLINGNENLGDFLKNSLLTKNFKENLKILF